MFVLLGFVALCLAVHTSWALLVMGVKAALATDPSHWDVVAFVVQHHCLLAILFDVGGRPGIGFGFELLEFSIGLVLEPRRVATILTFALPFAFGC